MSPKLPRITAVELLRALRRDGSKEVLRSLDASLQSVVDGAVPLSKYAWMYRYPGEIDQPSRTEAEEALALPRAVYGAVLARLPTEARPELT